MTELGKKAQLCRFRPRRIDIRLTGEERPICIIFTEFRSKKR